MQLNKRAIKEFQEIYFRKEEEKLSDEKAAEAALNLLLVFDAIYRSIPWEQNKVKKIYGNPKKSKNKAN